MDKIYQQYAQTVYKYLISITHNEDLAEDLTQETFYQAIRSIDRFDGKCKISTWLCAIAKNLYFTYLRKHKEHEDVDETVIPVGSAENDVMQALGKVELLRKFHGLEEPYREVTYLRVFGGLSFTEIGEVLGKTENWARVTFYRGKEKLRKEVDMESMACVLIGVVGNLDHVTFEYTVGGEKMEKMITAKDATEFLGQDVKDCGGSVRVLEALFQKTGF